MTVKCPGCGGEVLAPEEGAVVLCFSAGSHTVQSGVVGALAGAGVKTGIEVEESPKSDTGGTPSVTS